MVAETVRLIRETCQDVIGKAAGTVGKSLRGDAPIGLPIDDADGRLGGRNVGDIAGKQNVGRVNHSGTVAFLRLLTAINVVHTHRYGAPYLSPAYHGGAAFVSIETPDRAVTAEAE